MGDLCWPTIVAIVTRDQVPVWAYERVVLGPLGSESIQFPRVGVQFKLYLTIHIPSMLSQQTEEQCHEVQFVVGVWGLNHHQKDASRWLPFYDLCWARVIFWNPTTITTSVGGWAVPLATCFGSSPRGPFWQGQVWLMPGSEFGKLVQCMGCNWIVDTCTNLRVSHVGDILF